MSKPFFYRIMAVDLCAAVMQIPAGKHQEWLTQFALDLASGQGTLEYSKKVIAEVEQYRSKQSDLGRKGAENKKKRKQATLKRPLSDPVATLDLPLSDPQANSSNSNKKEYPYSEVIDSMNGILGTRYTASDSTKELIRARCDEGMTVDDFATVCRHQLKEWRGTNMDKYLRPKTLFCASNMQGYLNTAIRAEHEERNKPKEVYY